MGLARKLQEERNVSFQTKARAPLELIHKGLLQESFESLMDWINEKVVRPSLLGKNNVESHVTSLIFGVC